VRSVFCEFTENSNIVLSFHHSTAVKRRLGRLGDIEIESQLKCKKCDVGQCSSLIFRGVAFKGAIQFSEGGMQPVYTSSR
jgi:hypothetical protein